MIKNKWFIIVYHHVPYHPNFEHMSIAMLGFGESTRITSSIPFRVQALGPSPLAPHLRPGSQGISMDLMGHGCHWSNLEAILASFIPKLPDAAQGSGPLRGTLRNAAKRETTFQWVKNGLLDANCIAATVAMFCNFDVFINLLFGCGRWAAWS